MNRGRLSSLQLEAFLALSRALNFSRAAEAVHITQSALSQRIKALEDELGHTLFIRSASRVRLTVAGERLLRFCHQQEKLEEELVGDLGLEGNSRGIAGTVKIATYSSLLRSVVIPALSGFLRSNLNVSCEFSLHEMSELESVLDRSEADFVVVDHRFERTGVEERFLGFETYLEIESTRYEGCERLYLDNARDDRVTEDFFKHFKIKSAYRRSFMGDCYGILDGVALGLGRAVMSKHLIEKGMPVRVINAERILQLPVTLHYFSQPYYSRLQLRLIHELEKNCSKFL